MSIIETLILDRTAQDVAALTAKGHYNLTDLNRVATAMRYLTARFNQYGYSVTVTSRTNWVITDTPRPSEMDTYIQDVKALRDVFSVLSTTPKAPNSASMLTWKAANDIEQILADIDLVINRVLGSFKRSGAFTFWSGVQPLPSAESDLGRTVGDFGAEEITVGDLDAHGTSFYILGYGVLK